MKTIGNNIANLTALRFALAQHESAYENLILIQMAARCDSKGKGESSVAVLAGATAVSSPDALVAIKSLQAKMLIEVGCSDATLEKDHDAVWWYICHVPDYVHGIGSKIFGLVECFDENGSSDLRLGPAAHHTLRAIGLRIIKMPHFDENNESKPWHITMSIDRLAKDAILPQTELVWTLRFLEELGYLREVRVMDNGNVEITMGTVLCMVDTPRNPGPKGSERVSFDFYLHSAERLSSE